MYLQKLIRVKGGGGLKYPKVSHLYINQNQIQFQITKEFKLKIKGLTMNIEIWIVLAALFLIGEMLTTSFFLMWFGIGASASAVLNYLGFDPLVQFIAFIIISLILLGVSRPFAQRISKDSPKKAAADRLIGKQALVIEEIVPHNGGLVKIDGDVWKAVASQTIEDGQTVNIEKIEGIKLVVKPIEKKIKGD